MLSEEQKDLKERIEELEKKIEENQQKDVHDIKEIIA
jgi:cell division septum initiation protein DivIVA